MPFNDSMGNPLYFAYKDKGTSLGLVLPALVLNTVALAGVLMNSMVVYATVTTKSLHGTANFLLAMISTFEVLHQSGHIIFLIIAVSGQNFMTIYTAVRLELPMLFGMNAAMLGLPLTAFDRLFALLAPNIHRKVSTLHNHKYPYLGFLTMLCVGYGLYWDYYCCVSAAGIAEMPTTGLISDVLHFVDSAGAYQYVPFNTTLNSTAALCYLVIWILIKSKKEATKETNVRVRKALMLIVLVNIGGYVLTMATFELLFAIQNLEFVLIWRVMFVAGNMTLNLAAACNATVLYFTSTDYRRAFAQILNKLFAKNKSLQKTTLVAPKPMGTQPISDRRGVEPATLTT